MENNSRRNFLRNTAVMVGGLVVCPIIARAAGTTTTGSVPANTNNGTSSPSTTGNTSIGPANRTPVGNNAGNTSIGNGTGVNANTATPNTVAPNTVQPGTTINNYYGTGYGYYQGGYY